MAIRGWIPKKVSNRVVVAFLELLRRWQRLWPKRYLKERRGNEEAFENHRKELEKRNGYIEDQNAYTDMHFGKVTMQYAGCEIMAVYNALRRLRGGEEKSLAQLICSFEQDGMVLSGRFGSSPKSVRDYLQKEGFQTKFSVKKEDFQEMCKDYEVLILTMYNDKDDILQEIHTVCLTKEQGALWAHNVNCDGTLVGPATDYEELMKKIHKGRAKAIALTAIATKVL